MPLCLQFSKASDTYDNAAFIQQNIAQDLTEMLCNCMKSWSIIVTPKNIVDIGAGTGILSEKLCTVFDDTIITLVDISKSMLEIAQKKFKQKYLHDNTKCIFKYINMDAEHINFQAINRYDLIASNMALQWFIDIDSFLKYTADCCHCIAISMPILETFRNWYDILDNFNIAYNKPNYKSYKEFVKVCTQLNYSNISIDKKIYNIHFKSPEACMKYIQAIGAYSSNPTCNLDNLKKLISANIPVTLNYNVAFAVININ